jgi:uncharacterized damage-inducible protein DinB
VNRPALLTFATALCAFVYAQSPTALMVNQGKAQYNSIKNNLTKAAEKMPEDAYSFKPTPELQSFGERVAHMANQIGTCSRVKGGEPKQNQAAGKTSKADLVAALKAAFAECDAAWEMMNETTAMETMAGRGGQTTKLGTLIQNNIHDNEVYGTMTVYMRLKGLVPPSSEGARGGK